MKFNRNWRARAAGRVCALAWVIAVNGLAGSLSAQTQSQYDHGNPTDAEQLILEWVNRGRANPVAEAVRFGLSLNQGLPAGTISTLPKQPLVFNQNLQTAALGHSTWMLSSGVFAHMDAQGKYEIDRVEDASYPLDNALVGENLAHYASSVPGQNNLQSALEESYRGLMNSPWHRENMLYWEFREAGQDVKYSLSGAAINLYVTQNFATTDAAPLQGGFITGVVYDDRNGDGQYSYGEGVGGVTVTPSAGSFYAVTSDSGGYAIPAADITGAIVVQFDGQGFAGQQVSVSVESLTNVKVDQTVPELGAPFVRGCTLSVDADGVVTVEFEAGGRPASEYLLQASLDVSHWGDDRTATLTPLENGRYRFTSNAYIGDPACYFRVVAIE